MGENSLKKSFLKFCEDKKFEKNKPWIMESQHSHKTRHGILYKIHFK